MREGNDIDIEIVKFAPLVGAAGPDLWQQLADMKLNTLRLSESPVPLRGYYESSRHEAVGSVLRVDSVAASNAADDEDGDAEALGAPRGVTVDGELRNFNTMEGFKSCDRARLMQDAAKQIVQHIASGAAVRDPRLLSRFILLTFADLKTYKFVYWFAMPAVMLPSPLICMSRRSSSVDGVTTDGAPSLRAFFNDSVTREAIVGACENFHSERRQAGAFEMPCWLLRLDASGSKWSAHALQDWEAVVDAEKPESYMLAFADHSNLAAHPGWCLRNLALLAGVTWHARRLRVLCVRSLSNGIGVDETRCSVLDIEIPELGSWWRGVARGPSEAGDGSSTAAAVDAVGWERDAKGRHRPRVVDLKSTMDPRCLASSAVDLNLRLMRWRVLPELDVETLNTTRCLLIGAGTLGCNVSRLLLAWGVRTLTFVDSGKVSYSNPVRQSLYTFKDCREGRPKAGVAADALKEVYPDVDAEGVCISVPMPGHPVAESEKRDLCESLDTLEELVQAHDVVFLLTDTRESRWLPTMLCTKHNKICINAALGFDAYVVLRHGAALSATNASTDTASDDRLGCYFCNDVVAPLDSTSNRTLDQQCTVTRPGLAMVASAVAVEMMANLLHHPQRAAAPSESPDASDVPSALGPLPHSVRGSLYGFTQMSITGKAFSQCTACSACVVNAYKERGHDFVLDAINSPTFLEDLTGLTDLHKMTDLVIDDWDDDEDDEDAEGDDF